MKKGKIIPLSIASIGILATLGCNSKENGTENNESTTIVSEIGDVKVDRFADIQVLRYEIKDFDKLLGKK